MLAGISRFFGGRHSLLLSWFDFMVLVAAGLSLLISLSLDLSLSLFLLFSLFVSLTNSSGRPLEGIGVGVESRAEVAGAFLLCLGPGGCRSQSKATERTSAMKELCFRFMRNHFLWKARSQDFSENLIQFSSCVLPPVCQRVEKPMGVLTIPTQHAFSDFQLCLKTEEMSDLERRSCLAEDTGPVVSTVTGLCRSVLDSEGTVCDPRSVCPRRRLSGSN